MAAQRSLPLSLVFLTVLLDSGTHGKSFSSHLLPLERLWSGSSSLLVPASYARLRSDAQQATHLT